MIRYKKWFHSIHKKFFKRRKKGITEIRGIPNIILPNSESTLAILLNLAYKDYWTWLDQVNEVRKRKIIVVTF
jgi:hypothetical protein